MNDIEIEITLRLCEKLDLFEIVFNLALEKPEILLEILTDHVNLVENVSPELVRLREELSKNVS